MAPTHLGAGIIRPTQTHETFLSAVRMLALGRINATATPEEWTRLTSAKLVYGVGAQRGARGVCYFDAWRNGTTDCLLEIAASAEESVTQLAGTTLHELAHVLAGHAAGHGPEWKIQAARLGLRYAQAAGQHYMPAAFAQDVRFALATIPAPTDGNPLLAGQGAGIIPFFGLPHPGLTPRPCPMGYGTRGGTSRGTGSGSRLLKVSCATCGYTVRVTAKWLRVGAPICPTDGVAMKAAV